MQRVSALLPSWDKTRPNSNTAVKTRPSLAALDKVFGWVDKTSSSSSKHLSGTNSTPVQFVKEEYWPTTLDKECDKAARILKSFCTDGFLAQEEKDSRPPSLIALVTSNLVTKKIPPRIIQNAVGLAIFSCMRSGLWMSGSGGSGVLIARKADGTWSPPSGILLHTATLGFIIGVDIYDCVLVINSVAALEIFTQPKVTLGADVNLTVGPLVTAGLLENDIRWRELDRTVLTYLKARGKHQHVELDGSLVTERGNENERFYAGDVHVLDILAGNIHKSIPEMRPLFEVIKAAEGRTDFDAALVEMLAQQPAPGDAIIQAPKPAPLSPPRSPFGIPCANDPDPFGVIALEMAGLEIREAGTRLRPTSNQFEFSPSPTSPVFSKFSRQSVDTYLSKRSNRDSVMSTKSQGTQTDACVQTDEAATPETMLSRNTSDDGHDIVSGKLPTVMEPEEVDYTMIDLSAIQHVRRRDSIDGTELTKDSATQRSRHTLDPGAETDDASKASSTYPKDERDEDADDEDEEEEDDAEEEEPVVYEVATAAPPTRAAIMSTQVTQLIQAKGALVTIPKRIPPPLPPRSPARASRASKSDYGDISSLRSPLRNSFQSTDVQVERVPTPSIQEDTPVSPTDPTAAIFATTQSVATPAKGPLDADKYPFQRHHKQASSVYTNDENRWSTGSNHSPPTPQIGETASSADESEHEPQTPKLEDESCSTSSQREKTELKDDIRILAQSASSNNLAVA